MGETSTTRVQQLQTALRPWQRQHDLLLEYVLTRVMELDALGAAWPSVLVQKVSVLVSPPALRGTSP